MEVKSVTLHHLFFTTVQTAIQQTSAQQTFRTKQWKKTEKNFYEAFEKDRFPALSTIETLKHLFPEPTYLKILDTYHKENQSLSITTPIPRRIIDFYYDRIQQRIGLDKFSIAPIRKYLKNELELHPYDALATARHIVETHRQYKLPDIEKIILTADFFTNDEIEEIVHYANREDNSKLNYTAKEAQLDAVIIYAKSKTKKKLKNETRQTAILATKLEHSLHTKP